MVSKSTDIETIDSFLSGDKAAYETLMTIIDNVLITWRSRLGYQIDDVKSDVIYELWRMLEKGEFTAKISLRNFIAHTVNHICIDYIRFNRKYVDSSIEDIELPSKILTPEEKLQRKQTNQIVFRVLRLMPRECLQLWRLHLNSNMSCSEIGRTMGKSEASIRSRLWSCREFAKRIREQILNKDQRI